MTKLEELYTKRQTFLEYGMEVPEKLANEIRGLENSVFFDTILMTYCTMPRKAETETSGSFTVMIEYHDDELVNVGVSKNFPVKDNADIFMPIDKAKEQLGENDEDIDVVADDSSEDENENTEEEIEKRKKSKSIGFTVRFADGKIIRRSTARSTMIEALRYMGLERASKYDGDSFRGYRLIGKNRRSEVPGVIWQKMVDGWWIYVNMSNNRAINCLKGVAKMLNIQMEIILDEEPSIWPENNPSKHDDSSLKGKRTLFSLNNSFPQCKNKSVLEAVRFFLKSFPDAKFKDIEAMFPSHLQGSYGVVRTVEDINARKTKNRTEERRWFLDSSEILHDADGVEFAVSNEWGDNFEYFRKHVEESFGWKLEEIG